MDLMFSGKQSRTQRRATELAKADYRLLAALVKVRKERGLSQQDVADILGITQPTVAVFERSDADPKLSTIRRYAHAIGAMVTHRVSADNGQFDHVDDWSASTYQVEIQPTKTYPAPSSKVADFALAS